MAHRKEVRPEEAGSDDVTRPGVDAHSVNGAAHDAGSDEPEANRLEGRASIAPMGWVYKPESLIIGYVPLESRTKQWATESQIEGWFPPPGGERHGCKSNFQISAVALSTRLNRFAAVVLSRSAANGLSTTFVVRRCFQRSSGKS